MVTGVENGITKLSLNYGQGNLRQFILMSLGKGISSSLPLVIVK